MKLKYRGIEKRRFDRINTNFIAVCRLRKSVSVIMSAMQEDIDALILDLSEGGMALSVDHNIPISTRFSIRFILVHSNTYTSSDFYPIQVKGKVCSNLLNPKGRYRLGISFIKISKADKKAIINFIEDMKQN